MEGRYSPERAFETSRTVTPTQAITVDFDHGQVENAADTKVGSRPISSLPAHGL
jgi:hypothetical protein